MECEASESRVVIAFLSVRYQILLTCRFLQIFNSRSISLISNAMFL